ncbi:hypothetical protein PSTG_09616 [Puccinia striiformis f. sp. tritici PST-78]|uniref:HAT C-terminal dimerisation domain-containing protein n=1 Tax=Puccinia striiformis f. sp. tritici PST-78 TaxID=1165861 RepID=A0A0L0VCZ0_9BASI|nr:hypothetical protein PSTG_09616 [Puccinia striiformis f. sp. tritici PST-78]
MAPSRKRKKKNPTPLESSAISSPTNPSNQNDSEPGDEDDGDQHSPHELTTPTQAPLTDEEALQRARTNYANGISASYKMYLTPELSSQLDKLGRRMIAYPCKLCGQSINWPTSDSSCGNLNKHVAGCLRKQKESKKTHSLANLGIKGTGDIDAKEVSQLCAVWCAEAARPFSALVDKSHQALLHPTILKHLPSRRAVSRDIHMLYSAIQQKYKAVLMSHTGALYLGVDAWQSPNGFDILGIVIYRLEELASGKSKLEAMPLDFVRLSQRHTGAYLADSVRLVVEKFGIQQKICGIVSDNASNNEVMVRELKKQKWPRFKGEGQWVRCFAHVLNLIVQGILRPFGTNKKNTTATTNQDGSSGSDSGTDYAAEQIRPFNRDQDTSSGEEESSSSEIETAGHLEDSDLLNLDDIENASDEDETDRYTSNGCKESLAKFRAIAKKLRYSPNSKAEFIDVCRDKGCSTPHTVERDVCTRWNSTYTQLTSIVRCKDAILEWQRHKQHGVVRRYYLDQSDFDLAQDLAAVLNLFYEITQQLSISGSPRLSNTVVFIDQITEHLSSAISSPTYPPALRNAFLHPSFRDEYFKLANWEPEWITEAIRLAREMWVSFYKPKPVESTPSSSSSNNRPKTSMLAGLGSAAAARGGILSLDPLDIWLAGGLILDGDEPVNPLKWWSQQKRAGNNHGGLVQMALDVLSCPATSVDVERAFSFGRDYVSSKRHRLSSESLSRGMTVAFYSKNGLIKDGLLDKWKADIQAGRKVNAKDKGKNKVIVLDED